MELWDEFLEDVKILGKSSVGRELVKQLARSIDSIAANIEEGFGRGFGKEYPYFLKVARGSARETKGRYKRARHFLSEEIIDLRIKKLDAIISMLTKTIITLEKKNEKKSRKS